jgi:branched-chain amino acid transport system permease protein
MDARRGGASASTTTSCPTRVVGTSTRRYLYWLALGYLGVVFFIVRWSVESSPGRVWQAIRENELRVEVLGLRPRVQADVVRARIVPRDARRASSTYCSSTARTRRDAPNFTLSLLLMVVIGGAGSRWGAVLGGVLYTYLDNRLGALGSSSAVQDLPQVLRTPLEQPLFLLGTIFILIVFFLPGGIAGLGVARAARRPARARGGDPSRAAVGGTPEAALTEPRRAREHGRARGRHLAYDVEGSASRC